MTMVHQPTPQQQRLHHNPTTVLIHNTVARFSFVVSFCRVIHPVSSWTFTGMNESPHKPSPFPKWCILSPSTVSSSPLIDGCRFAKDEQYLAAVLNEWKNESSTWTVPVEIRDTIIYPCHESSQIEDTFEQAFTIPMYGHIVRPKTNSLESIAPPWSPPPGRILLFHTAAGPHDVFLLWKASYLASEMGCEVMICDILGDEDGWGWTPERTRYNTVRAQLLRNNSRLLKSRVRAAIQAISKLDDDDGNAALVPLACMGWCLGAQPIIELCSFEDTLPPVAAIVTFHGVFHRPDTTSLAAKSDESTPTSLNGSKMLICNGVEDPFVSEEDIHKAKKMFEHRGYDVKIRQFAKSKHGFTNPAQAFNPNESFGYNDVTAKDSWNEAIQLLKNQFEIP